MLSITQVAKYDKVGPVGKSSLGILANSVTPPHVKGLKEFLEQVRERKFALQSAARDLLPGERIEHCLRTPNGRGHGNVTVNYVPSTDTAHYGGLQTCGSVWACPVCSAKISIRRREELRMSIEEAEKRGWSVVMVTFTLQHTVNDALKDLVEALNDSYRRVKRGNPWKRFLSRYGVKGNVTAHETTHGAHGWHPHKHVVLYIEHELSDQAKDDMQEWLSKRFCKMLAKNGRYGSPLYAVDVRSKAGVVDYVTKWGLDQELTGNEKKHGHGLTPFQLLDLYRQGDKRAGQLFQEYAKTMKGKRQLVWSHGFRDLLGLGKEEDDAALAAAQEEDAVILVTLTPEQWRHVLRHRARAKLLNVAASGDVARVLAYLDKLKIPISGKKGCY